MTELCYHCKQAIDPSLSITANIDGKERPMCCYGCKAVAEIIADSGLSQYYSLRTQPAEKFEQDRFNDHYQLFDQTAFNKDFVSCDDEDNFCADLLIENLSCAACTWLVESALKDQQGTISANVNLQDKRLRVRWNGKKTSLSTLLEKLGSYGYQAKPFVADSLRESQVAEHRTFLKRLGVAFIGMMQVGMFAIGLHAGDISYIADEYRDYLRWISALVATPVVFYSASPFFQNAWRSLKAFSAGMDLPVSLAIGIAYLFSIFATLRSIGSVYFDSIIMFTFLLLLGRYLEMRARHQLGDPATALKAILPRTFNQHKNHSVSIIPIADIKVDNEILIKPGEVIPADSLVIEGRSNVDEATFTGESQPQAKHPGNILLAGTINIDSPLIARVTQTSDTSRLNTIYDLLVEAQAHKPNIANLTDKLAVRFVIFILVASLSTALYWWLTAPEDAIWIALSVLVVSCPCALSLATPTALTAAITRLKNLGVLVVSCDVIDKLVNIDRVIFDKTGTLTHGSIQLAQTIVYADLDETTCLSIAKSLESHSEHPIARAFKPLSAEHLMLHNVQQTIGAGIAAELDGHIYKIGRNDFVCNDSIDQPTQGQWIALSRDGELVARFELLDTLRIDAHTTVTALIERGYHIDILSGDNESTVANVAKQLGIDHWRSALSPEDKLAYLKDCQSKGEHVLMVGDGINDFAILAGADVSIAMGMASDLAKTHADLILLNSSLKHIDSAIAIAHGCQSVIRQNIGWALCYNLFAIPFAMVGWVYPYQAAIGMSLSSLIVVINALRFKGKTS